MTATSFFKSNGFNPTSDAIIPEDYPRPTLAVGYGFGFPSTTSGQVAMTLTHPLDVDEYEYEYHSTKEAFDGQAIHNSATSLHKPTIGAGVGTYVRGRCIGALGTSAWSDLKSAVGNFQPATQTLTKIGNGIYWTSGYTNHLSVPGFKSICTYKVNGTQVSQTTRTTAPTDQVLLGLVSGVGGTTHQILVQNYVTFDGVEWLGLTAVNSNTITEA
jgi:hypothetical protein